MTNYDLIRLSIGKNNGENFHHEHYRVIMNLLETNKLTSKQSEAIVRLLMDYNYMKD